MVTRGWSPRAGRCNPRISSKGSRDREDSVFAEGRMASRPSFQATPLVDLHDESCQWRLLFWWFASGLIQHRSWPPGLGCHTYFCLRREKNESRLAGYGSTWTQLSKAVLVEYPPTSGASADTNEKEYQPSLETHLPLGLSNTASPSASVFLVSGYCIVRSDIFRPGVRSLAVHMARIRSQYPVLLSRSYMDYLSSVTRFR
ncbi:hypothetical protein QBC33DRAFT_551976 [Phialemonium atrogriseum]|uniref:Uncharacterized protein n=1 Tax=Phialemonium atrogriseum TaxID=1093897 RepID=A0AAJ0BQ04_9PEZI|nr:uncharacterized protein QBC33DRAFT_551976 [Phialemonium atrogriseum]KAK1762354.1 hypothetical protein QBC33DRAFT_551976 [Phialemonium atrogriseum]